MKSIASVGLFLIPGLALALLSCGKKDESSLLAYIPSDTPYVFAAVEAPSKELTESWLKRAQPLWPIYEKMIDEVATTVANAPAAAIANDSDDAITDVDSEDGDEEAATDDTADAAAAANPALALSEKATEAMKETIASSSRIAKALIADLRGRDSAAKMSETGLKIPGHSAIYGIGAVPVARIELSSADAFRAWIAKIESASATRFSTGTFGDQDYWYVGNDKLQMVLAVQAEQLVVTLFPAKADDALRQRLLGISKPEQSLAHSGTLEALIKAESYSPVAAGWVDFQRLFALYPTDPGLLAMTASMGEQKMPALTAECRNDFESIIAKAPRMIAGYSELSPNRMNGRGRWELAPTVGADLLALTPAPVAAGADYPGALFDMAVNLPVLKLKDFALKQAKAIVAQPYRCETLQPLNKAATESVEKLAQVLPPPFSDITGFRVTIDSLTMPPAEGSIPDVRGKLLVASRNPSFLIGLAQMAMPNLASVVIKQDGQPVEVPMKDMPMPAGIPVPPVHVAMTDRALALSFGAGEEATLSAYVSAPAGVDGDWVKTGYSGEIYALQGEFMQRMQALLPESPKKGELNPATMKELYQFYADTFQHLGGSMRLSPKGIEFDQTVELKP
ncbi:MAG: hypothetical protein ABIR16_05890 [Dokdonella sp.]